MRRRSNPHTGFLCWLQWPTGVCRKRQLRRMWNWRQRWSQYLLYSEQRSQPVQDYQSHGWLVLRLAISPTYASA
jgi:hypothetical protein